MNDIFYPAMTSDEKINGKKALTAFDFDGTLTKGDSFLRFAIFALGKRKTAAAILRTLPWIGLWKTGLVSNSRAKQRLFSALFRSMPVEDFRNYGKRFATEILPGLLRQDIVKELRTRISNGEEAYIVTASMAEWIEPWADVQGVKKVVATMPETNSEGLLTGKFLTRNCHGAEKVDRLYKEIPSLKNDRESIYLTVFGDSSGDRELMAFADVSHLV